ncbi:hypothetical protein RSOL_361790 [Rhizoctonia solani AG-3 Rhs1AP]|uniref:Uncharacterized protein n=2 Tax=Rhizoctonia solani AG-3 TaxID=1086053 RepID=A0A074RFE1_9AGAM|nr:hypothetical protein RSOL_361790 [Rhizoctonia solani AG-3 Rhs1AP]KEP45811.1 hypothetical protein V565_239560 [Rhizoctonia solani 123E]
MSDADFGERRPPRKRGNGAKALLRNDAYMWAPDDPEDPKDLHERFFRSECLIRATKLLLLGPSSLDSAKRSPQSGSPRRDIWRIKSITPSILSFVAVVVHFVLSGDLSFDITTLTANYAKMYEGNLRLLKVHKQRRGRDFKNLISLYNQALFPDQQAEEANQEFSGMSEARRAFYQSMIDGGSDEVADE